MEAREWEWEKSELVLTGLCVGLSSVLLLTNMCHSQWLPQPAMGRT